MNKYSRASGLTLIEVMISLVLGLLVIGGVIQVFISTSLASRNAEGMSRVQESGRFAIQYLKPRLRMANKLTDCFEQGIELTDRLNRGDAGYNNAVHNVNATVTAWNHTGTSDGDSVTMGTLAAGSGSAGDWTEPGGSALMGSIVNNAAQFSDVIMIKRAVPIPGLTLCTGQAPGNTSMRVNINNQCGASPPDSGLTTDEVNDLLPVGSFLYATSCVQTRSDYFQLSDSAADGVLGMNTGGSLVPGNAAGGMSYTYGYGSEPQLLRVFTTAYYIGVNAQGNPGLYEMNFGPGGATATELIEGVENMQVSIGTLNNPGAALALQDPSASAINLASAVRLSLLIRSADGADNEVDTQTYALGGVTVDPVDDTRMRKVFSVTSAIRNSNIQVVL